MMTALSFIHRLELLQQDMRLKQFYGAARSLEMTITHLRQEYDLSVLKFENTYEKEV